MILTRRLSQAVGVGFRVVAFLVGVDIAVYAMPSRVRARRMSSGCQGTDHREG